MPGGPAPSSSPSSISIEGAHAAISLVGRLDANTLAAAWDSVITPLLRTSAVTRATIDASKVEYCNGAGLALLVEIDRILRTRNEDKNGADFQGLSDELTRLLDRALPKKPPPIPQRPLNSIEQIGASTAAILADMRAIIEFLGECLAAFAWAVTHPHRVRWQDVLLVAEKAGANAVPVVCLLGWLVGLIISFQSAAPLQRFDADSTIPMLLSISMVRELGPLFTAIVLAGRSGSAFAAEIGTMKVTEEVNALTTFGLDPVRFLVVPRILAAVLMTPLLSVLCTLAGLVGGYLVMATLGYSLTFYVNEVRHSVDMIDFLQGFFKTGVFAFLVCGIGCLRGLRTASGPGAVGDSTTRAVVAGIILTVAADGVLGVVFYFAGI